jgi:hypothetical protein
MWLTGNFTISHTDLMCGPCIFVIDDEGNQIEATQYFTALFIGSTHFRHHYSSPQPGHLTSHPAPDLRPPAAKVSEGSCDNQRYSCELLMMGTVVPEIG